MAKKIAVMVVTTVMALSVFAFTGCEGFSLADYRASGRTAIQTHADAKVQENSYTDASLQAIAQAVTNGKAAVDAAESKTAVDTAVSTAKEEINAVPKKNLELTEELVSRIKADYLQEFGYELCFGDELLNKFYGIYNGAAVFFIAGEDAALKTVIISGVAFSYNYGWTILVWKDGVFYNLENIESIFEVGILTQSDLEQIGIIHSEANVKE